MSLALALAAALMGGVYLYIRLDDEIRCHVEGLLQEQCEDFDVQVGSARLVEGRGIVIRDLTISDKKSKDRPEALVTIDEVFVAAEIGLSELMEGKLDVGQVIIRRPKCRIVYQPDGRWNLSSLMPTQKLGAGPLNLLIEGGRVELAAGPDDPKPLVLRDIRLTAKRGTDGLQETTATDSAVHFEASCTSPDVQQISFRGAYDMSKDRLSVSGKITRLRVSTQLLARIPKNILPNGSEMPQVDGLIDCNFQVSLNGDNGPFQFAVREAKLSDGRCLDVRLPLPLNDIRAEWSCDDEGLVIDKLTGRFGQAGFNVSGKRTGWGENATVALILQMTNLSVGQRLIESFHAPASGLWKKFHPEGTIDVNAQLAFDGTTWRPENVVATCGDLTYVAEKFPYRITGGKGTIRLFHRPELQTNECRINLTAVAGGQPIQIEAQHTHLGPRALGWIRVTGENIPIDDAFIDALPQNEESKAREFIRSLHPTGRFDATWLAWRENTNQEKQYTDLDVTIADCTVRYDKFPYPLRDISGRLHGKNGHWKYEQLEGTNNVGVVRCNGRMTPLPEGKQLVLQFTGENIALEQDILGALNPEMQALWRQLRPRGRVDLQATLLHTTGQAKPTITVTMRPRQDTVSIKPDFFPYSLERLEGDFSMTEGKVLLENVRAKHRQTAISASGVCDYQPNGAWQLAMKGISVDRLTADADLLVALPTGLRQLLVDLQPKGTFGLHDSSITFRGEARPQQPIQSSWKLRFSLHQATLQAGLELENINGGLVLEGQSDDQGFVTQGELDLDSLTVHDLQFTEVHGPLWANEEYVLLGPPATRAVKQPKRHLTAKAYGGTLSGGARVLHADFPRFSAEVSFTDGDLARLAAEHMPGRQDLRGRVYGRLELAGKGRNAESIKRSLTGKGQVQLLEADLYELPQMIRLLNVLRIQKSNTTAFTRSDATFRIDGELIQIDQIQLRGDSLALHGKGEMGLDRKLNMAFQAVIGPGILPAPKLQRFLREASGQVMQINVRGTLDDPTFESEPLPGLNRVLQQLQAELEQTSRPNDPTRTTTRPRNAERLFGPPSRW